MPMLIGRAASPRNAIAFSASATPPEGVPVRRRIGRETTQHAAPPRSHFSCSWRSPVERRKLTTWRTSQDSQLTRSTMKKRACTMANHG